MLYNPSTKLHLQIWRFKLHNTENRAFAQMFLKTYAAQILECHLNPINVVRVGGFLPDRVTKPIFSSVLKQQVVQLYSLQIVPFHIFMSLAIHRIGIVNHRL